MLIMTQTLPWQSLQTVGPLVSLKADFYAGIIIFDGFEMFIHDKKLFM